MDVKLAGRVRIWKTYSAYVVSTPKTLRWVGGTAEDAVLMAIRLTMPCTLDNVDIGGTLWLLESGDEDVRKLLEIGLAELHPSRPFSTQPTPIVGVNLWAAARLGVQYQLESAMAKAKGPVEVTFDAFGLGVITFIDSGDNRLAFKSWTPTAGVHAFVETIFNVATRSLAAPVVHDEPVGGASTSSSADAKDIVNNLAPTPSGAPDLGRGIDPIETQPRAAEDAMLSEVEDADSIDVSDFPGMDDTPPRPVAKPASAPVTLPASSSATSVEEIFGAADFDDTATEVSYAEESGPSFVGASNTELEMIDEDEDPLLGAFEPDVLTGGDVGQVASSVIQSDPTRVGLLPGEPAFPVKATLVAELRTLVPKLNDKGRNSINAQTQSVAGRTLEALFTAWSTVTGGKAPVTLEMLRRLDAAGRREDINIAFLLVATKVLLAVQQKNEVR